MSRSESRRRSTLTALRLLPAERDALQAAADALGISLSALIRSGALAAIGYQFGHHNPTEHPPAVGGACLHPFPPGDDELAAIADQHMAVFGERAALWELLKEQTRRLQQQRAANAAPAQVAGDRATGVVAPGCDLEPAQQHLAIIPNGLGDAIHTTKRTPPTVKGRLR